MSYVISYMISYSSRPGRSFPRINGQGDRRDSNVLWVGCCRAYSATQCNERFEAVWHLRWMGPNCATRWCSIHLPSISGHTWEVCLAPDHSYLQSMSKLWWKPANNRMWGTILALDPPCLVWDISVAHVILQLLLDHFKTRRFQQMNIKPLLASEIVVCPAVLTACVGFCALCLHMVDDITYDIIYDVIVW